MNPFDFVNSVSKDKKHMMRGTENDALAEKGYDCFLTNRSLSLHADSVMYANEMNCNYNIPSIMQYEYYLYSLRSKNRYGKWPKKFSDENLDIVLKYFKFSINKARAALNVLTKSQLDEIRLKLSEGGAS